MKICEKENQSYSTKKKKTKKRGEIPNKISGKNKNLKKKSIKVKKVWKRSGKK